jgi:4'-phosphopantetheinyl transferase
MSHSDGLIAYVLSPWFPVGIDVERVKPITDWRALATENFSEREQGELFSLPAAAQLEAFYRGWTRKEALLKAMARGIGEGLLRVEVSLAAGKGCCVHAIDGSKELADSWTLVEGSAPLGYVAAIGVKRER